MPSLFVCFYMPPPLGTRVIMFSGCPFVRPKPEISFFHLYMGPLVHPTNCDWFVACPSVHPERFPGICQRKHGGIGQKFCMMIHLDHLLNWLDYGHMQLILLFFGTILKVKWVKFGVSGHLPENTWSEWPEILHADVSWPPSKLISLWSRSVDF